MDARLRALERAAELDPAAARAALHARDRVRERLRSVEAIGALAARLHPGADA